MIKDTRSKPVIVTRPDGAEAEYISGAAAARGENLMQAYISKMARDQVSFKGYKVRFKAPAELPPHRDIPL